MPACGSSACSRLFLYWLAAAWLLNAADDPLSQGKLALAAGKYREAIAFLEQARDSSARCQTFFYLGLAHYRLKELDRAIIDLQSAAQCDANNADSRVALAVAYAERGDEERALVAFESALQLKPDHIEALRAAAALDLRRERNQKAVSKLEKLVAIESNDAQAHSDLGAAYAATSNFDKAREQFQKALQLRPDDASALVGFGNVYLKEGRIKEAVDLLSRAAKADVQAYEPHFLLAAAYNNLARYADAAAECNEALRLGGADPEIYYHLARAYRGLGREEDGRTALARFSALRSRSKNELEARREAARLLENAKPLVDQGKLSDAIALLEKAYHLDPGNPQLLFRLASLYYDDMHYETARQYVNAALNLAPSEWLYHYLLGLIEKASGRLDAARQSLETTVRLNPSAADAFNQLGDVAMRQQNFASAIRNFEQASRLDPRDAAYRLNLQTAQGRMAKK